MKYLKELRYSNLEQILWLDIETATIEKELEEESPFWNPWEQKMRYDGNITTTEDLKRSYKEKGGLYKEFSKIVSVSYGRAKDGKIKVKNLIGDEKEIIEELLQDIERFVAGGVTFLGVFSGTQFDIPYISFRAMVHDIPLTDSFDIGGIAPWNIKHVIDVQKILRGTSISNISLDGVCAAFGITSSKEGSVSAKSVNEAYWEGEVREIAKYNNKDVLATCNAFCKAIREPLVEMEVIETVKIETPPVLERILNAGKVSKKDISDLKKLDLSSSERLIALELVRAAYGEKPKKKLEQEVVEIFIK